MSIPRSTAMGTPFFYEFKKQATFFLREKIKNARLALTDVTPAELLTEEATNGNPWAPDAKTLCFISRSAFEIDDFWRIVDILHKKLAKFDLKHWRESYNSLVVLEHLLTHGPESVADEFLCDIEVIQRLGDFQYIDQRGFNWGLAVRKKSERVQKLLEKGPVLKEERDRARKLTRGIQGFGSMNYRISKKNQDEFEHSSDYFGRCNSHYENYSQQDDEMLEKKNKSSNLKDPQKNIILTGKGPMKADSADNMYERLADEEEATLGDEEERNGFPVEDMKQLLERPKLDFQKEEHHPFVFNEHQRMESMILLSQS
ncbi:epsin-2-like [Phalaenopsis equestris]|uniref:epsin-2-like n=1 Tax=Phalaenopsis equestris TaxID=78828 RepID=UPI0009E31D89|nr:epsin-2-like [Phalaenopsis equestris]